MSDWHLFEPFWRSTQVCGESLFFAGGDDGAPASAPLLFAPVGTVSVCSATRETVYEEGRDFLVDAAHRQLVRLPGSRLPVTARRGLYRTAGEEQSIPHLAGDPQTHLLFGEGRYFHDLQAEATYAHAEPWTGYAPADHLDDMPRLRARLQAREPVCLCLTGDSISAGANASACTGAAPSMPAYGDLVALGLQQRWGSPTTFTNLAVGGMGADHGVQVAPEAGALQPHLALIAYGMNDVGRRDPQGFCERIAAGMAVIRQASPQVEFVLVATMLGNPEWVHTPREMFALYRDALAGLCGPGVVLADLTSMWNGLLTRKTLHDLTGNGVNHPNDFGHRVYAQVILDLLGAARQRPIAEITVQEDA